MSRLRRGTICCPYEASAGLFANQNRLRSASILLIGMKALANEIAKNLVLAGIGSLTIVDDQVITEEDLGSQFFISELHVGMNVCAWTSKGQGFASLTQEPSERLLLFLKYGH